MKSIVDTLPSGHKSADEAAARWFLRLRDGNASKTDQAEFEIWRTQSQDNAEAFARVEAAWRNSAALASTPEILAMRAAALSVVPVSRRRAPLAAAAAAVLIALGALTLPMHRVSDILASAGLAPFVAPDRGTFATAIGERSTIVLKDGSVLTLDTNSAARVAYSDAERSVFLLQGQAMFDVAKNKQNPFVVYAGDRRIVATGTAFDVRLDRSSIEVTLVEGHVVVDQLAGGEALTDRVALARPVLPSARTELQPGERLVARSNAPATVSAADVTHVTSWRTGRLVFLDEPLVGVIREINRYTKTKVRLADKSLETLRVNGVFRTTAPMDFARALTQIYPVTVSDPDDGTVVITWKKPT